MDKFTNAILSPDEDAVMDASFHSQSTVREEGSYYGMPSYSMAEAGVHYAESSEFSEHYDPSDPAQTATTDTSWTGFQYSSGMFALEEPTQPTPFPPLAFPPQETELAGISGGDETDQSLLDRVRAGAMDTGLSLNPVLPERNTETGALIGSTDVHTQPRVLHQSSPAYNLGLSIGNILERFQMMLSKMEHSPDQMHPNSQDFALLERQANNMVREMDSVIPHEESGYAQAASTTLAVPLRSHPAPPSTTSSTVTRYRCLECDKCDTENRGIFTRHVNDMHHPKCMYLCPEILCPVEKPRRHQTSQHVMLVHRDRGPPTTEELNAHKRDNACPTQCPFCHVTVNSWRQWDECYRKHASYEVSSNATIASRRTSIDQGIAARDDAPNVDQPQQGMNSAPAQAPSGSNNSVRMGGYYPSASGENGPTTHPPSLSSASHNQYGGNAGPSHRQGNVPQPPDTRTQAAGDSRTPRQHPQSRPSNGTTQDPRPRAPRQESGPRCRRCSHRFNSCHQCRNHRRSTFFCHECPEFPMFLALARANHEQPMTGPSHDQQMYINPAATMLDQGYQAQPGSNQTMQGQYPSRNPRFMIPDWNGNGNGNGGMGPGSNGMQRNYQAMAMLSLDEPVFSEQELWPSVSGLKAAMPSGALLRILPMIDYDPIKKWLCKPLKGLGSLALSGLDFVTQFDSPRSKVAMVDPECQCKCACRAKARAELASGRKVEMKFKLRPVYRGTSHLRSRVEVVVKLLKLRSSANESKAKRKEAKSEIKRALKPTFENRAESIPDDESDIFDESDVESVFDQDEDNTDALSTSSSYSDIQSLVPTKPSSSASPEDPSDNSLLPLNENESEASNDGDILIQFDFDLGAALSKLEKWTGGSSIHIFSDMCISDPGRVFEYLTAYILYVIVALAHSRDHGGSRRLDN